MKNSPVSLLFALAAGAAAAVFLQTTMFVVRLVAVPASGQAVVVENGAEACKTFDEKLGEWGGCSNLPDSTNGVIVDKEGYAHVYVGRIRVQFEYVGYPEVYVYRWFRPADVKTR